MARLGKETSCEIIAEETNDQENPSRTAGPFVHCLAWSQALYIFSE